MINVLSDSLADLADVGRQAAQRARQSLSKQKAANYARVSKGRKGFAKPMNFQTTGLSNRARNNVKALQSGAAALGTLLAQVTFNKQEVDTQISVGQAIDAFQARLDANRALAEGSTDNRFDTSI